MAVEPGCTAAGQLATALVPTHQVPAAVSFRTQVTTAGDKVTPAALCYGVNINKNQGVHFRYNLCHSFLLLLQL